MSGMHVNGWSRRRWRAMRGLVKDGGTIVIADEKVAEEFAAPGDQVERFMYGFSAVHCLPVGMVESDSAGTGTVMRPSRLRQYAREAGFADIEILPVESDFWRFYRPILIPVLAKSEWC